MKFQMFYALCFYLIVMVTSGESWQSYGNMSQSNITLIRSSVAVGMTIHESSPVSGSIAVKNISDTLNAAWKPAWNVFIMYHGYGVGVVTSVVYGYAFNEHWLWYNDYTKQRSVILWKDYNCDSWVDISVDASGMTKADKDNVISYTNQILTQTPTINNDPWLFSYKMVNALQLANPTHAYTVVASTTQVIFNGCVCVVKNSDGYQYGVFFQNNKADPSKSFVFFVLRMR